MNRLIELKFLIKVFCGRSFRRGAVNLGLGPGICGARAVGPKRAVGVTLTPAEGLCAAAEEDFGMVLLAALGSVQ
jgi:hypothetical protein